MELKNISDVLAMSEEELDSYVDTLVTNIPENYPWEVSSIPTLLDTIRKFPADVIVHPLVLSYIIAYKIENIDNFKIYATDYVFEDTLRPVKLEHNDTIHYTVYPAGTLNHLINTVNIFRGDGLLPEDFKTRAELEVLIKGDSQSKDIVEYLKFLSLITEEEASYIIPVPSDTLDVDETTARFSDALWFEKIQNQTIILAGLGGIGSYVAFLLSRMHPNSLFMYDDDIVEAVNMAGQLYGSSHIGVGKAYAIGRFIRDMSNYNSAYCINERYTSDTQTADVMICGFDNMEARNTFFNNWVKHVESKPEEDRKNCLFIDGRLAAEEFQVFSIRGDDTLNIVKYAKEYLFSDDEADETLCSYKQTTYMANMIGSVMVNIFTNFVANSIEDNIRELPFITVYDGSTMTFKTYI